MKVAVLIMFALIAIVTVDLPAQTSNQSLEIPFYSNDESGSNSVDDSPDVEADEIDIYTSYQNKPPVFSDKKENRLDIYGILYGEPEKIKLPSIDADDVGIGIGVKLNF